MTLDKGFFDTWTPRALATLRIVTAFLFLQHGTAKLLHVPHVADFDKLPALSLIGFAGMLEIVGSLLILLGLFTRPAAFILSGEMAVAYFMAHASGGFFPIVNRGELAVVYCWVFLFIFFYLLLVAGAFVGIMATVMETQPRTYMGMILLVIMGLLLGQMLYRWRVGLVPATMITVGITLVAIMTGHASEPIFKGLNDGLNSLTGGAPLVKAPQRPGSKRSAARRRSATSTNRCSRNCSIKVRRAQSMRSQP